MNGPVARPGVAAVVIDGEAVIHHHGQVHVLDPVATLVWQSCDGLATVDELGVDLAAEFAAPSDTVVRDVSAAIGQLGALDLLLPTGPNAHGAEPAGELELLVDPPGSCAACAERAWPMRRTVRVGSRLVAVGTDRERADAALAGALAAHAAPTPPALAAEPPFFAVELQDRGSDGGPQRLDLVHRGDTVVARSRRPDQTVRALVAQLASYGDLRAAGLAVVNGLLAAVGDRAVIVAPPRDSVRFRHALERLGVLVADAPFTLVDPARREAVVGAPGLQVDLRAIAALADDSADREPDVLPWGRYRVIAIAVPEPASPAAALFALGPEVGDHRDHDATIDALVALLDSVPVTGAVEPDAIHALLTAG